MLIHTHIYSDRYIIADHLLIPISSLRNNFAKIDIKNGQEKNKAFAIAKVMNVKDI